MLYGRASERAVLRTLLDGALESRSGVVVLRGEPGIGKSALLRDLVENAARFEVLNAIGVESESELPYAGIHQLIWPLLDRIDDIPAPQALALRAAIGLAEGRSADDRFLIGAALLSLLAAVADGAPLLCVVDDAHWLDRASADALTFTARRLHAEPIAMVFSARVAGPRVFAADGLPELHLAGLNPQAAGELVVASSGSVLAPDVQRTLVRTTGGNPLALLELPTMLSADQLAGREPLADRLPVTRTLEDVFLGRARELPPESQMLMLLAAADDTGDTAIVLGAAGRIGIDPSVLDAVERSGLLHVTGSRIEFRHSLVRSAVYQGATFAERQVVHRALGEALAGDRYADQRLWHRAAATAGTDDELADELESSAHRLLARGGHAAAASALERAAALTGGDEHRARRNAAAAWETWLAGRLEAAMTLLESGRRMAAGPLVKADLAHLRALIELQRGSPSRAHEILMGAAIEILDLDPDKAGAMLVQAGEAANFAGDLPGEIAAGRLAERLRAEHHAHQLELTMMAGVANLLGGDTPAGAQLLAEGMTHMDASTNPRRFSWAGSAAYYLGDLRLADSYWNRFAEECRSDGAIALLAVALGYQAFGEAIEGRLSSAVVHASEGLKLAQDTGQDNCAALHLSIMARGAARAGSDEQCHEYANAVFAVAHVRGLGIQAGNATLALGELELARGRIDESLAHLETLMAGGPGASSVSVKLIGAPDLVEAAARAGRPERARDALALYDDWTTGTGSRFELPLLHRCRALLSAGAAAQEQYEQALRLHAVSDRPFDRARTELLYGEMLRRDRQPKQAREHLRAAVEVFDQLAAHPWAERARTELRASGGVAGRRDPSQVEQLTPQEVQIARVVADGASNKEVAAQLFLSPRTIEFHLRHIYPKLGITSRAQLGAFRSALSSRVPAAI